MKINKSKLLLLSALLLLGINSCGVSNSNSESVNQNDSSDSSNNYYNESNFIKSNKSIDETKIVYYDGPSYLKQSNDVSIKVNDEELFVYETRVNHGRKFSWEVPNDYDPLAIFDFEGKVNVKISLKDITTSIKDVKISPLVYGITPTFDDNTISFDLTYTDNYVIEYTTSNNLTKAVHLFANPIESEPITSEIAKNDPSIIYIGPGVYKADAIPLSSNSTLYIAGGAYVYGQIRTEGLENVTIKGRGIISGAIYDRRSESEYTIPVEIRKSKNVTISDITFLDPAGWTIALYKSENVTLNNVKIISSRQNSDGISVQSCKDVTVNGGFVRTWDDSLVVKNVDRGTTKNITFDGVTVWTDLAQSMEVGYETNGETMEDITFKNITIVHNYHKAAISLHNCDDAHISNVKYQNITLEDGQMLGDVRDDNENDFLIDFTIAYNVDWSQSGGIRGSVDNILIEDVNVYNLLPSIVSRMIGESKESNISNVTINGLKIKNKQVSNENDLGLIKNDYVNNVTINTKNEVLGAIKTLPYDVTSLTSKVSKTKNQNIIQSGMLVPKFSYSQGGLQYIGVAINKEFEVSATHGTGNKTNTPYDDGSGSYTDASSNENYVVDNSLSTTWTHKDFKGEDEEFVALTIDFKEKLTTVGVIRILGNQSNEFYYTYSFQVWGRRKKSDGTINTNYTRLSGLKDYEMSPGSNNCIDVNITAQEYAGLQLRFYKGNLVSSPTKYEIAQIQFYAPSLSFNKAIVASTEHNDVYNVEKLVDGNPNGTSYYESKSMPAYFVIDLGDLYTINAIVMCLPSSLLWDARTQEIEILTSSDNKNYDEKTTQFETLVTKKAYLFDPTSGNINVVEINNQKKVRFIKVIISSNNSKGGYYAQLSEFSVYGE